MNSPEFWEAYFQSSSRVNNKDKTVPDLMHEINSILHPEERVDSKTGLIDSTLKVINRQLNAWKGQIIEAAHQEGIIDSEEYRTFALRPVVNTQDEVLGFPWPRFPDSI